MDWSKYILGGRSHLRIPQLCPATILHRCKTNKVSSPNTNGKHFNSWNSSIHEDDFTTEWKPEYNRMLRRVWNFPLAAHVFPIFLSLSPYHLAFEQTLDTLPSHLPTPFNGLAPPSNLLDEITRDVAEAKGPAGCLHSRCATPAEVVKLAHYRARKGTSSPQSLKSPTRSVKPSGRIHRRGPPDWDRFHSRRRIQQDNIKDNQTINRSVDR